MYWEVGIKMDGISGVYDVHPQPLEQPIWTHAVEQLEFVKEFDSA
jgi:hypothetical protein